MPLPLNEDIQEVVQENTAVLEEQQAPAEYGHDETEAAFSIELE